MRSLRVSVSAIHPVVGVQAPVAAADVAYILMTVDANLDTSGRFRYIPEVVVVSDAVALAVTKALSSPSVLTSDEAVLETIKGLSETVSLSEAFVITLVFLRDFADTATITDLASLELSRPLLDGASVSDVSTRLLTKVLASGVAMNDSFEAGDGLLYSFAKGVSNVVFAADATALSQFKSVSDMITPADAGSLVSQGYCDPTYFAEDYVGESRTFS